MKTPSELSKYHSDLMAAYKNDMVENYAIKDYRCKLKQRELGIIKNCLKSLSKTMLTINPNKHTKQSLLISNKMLAKGINQLSNAL